MNSPFTTVQVDNHSGADVTTIWTEPVMDLNSPLHFSGLLDLMNPIIKEFFKEIVLKTELSNEFRMDNSRLKRNGRALCVCILPN